MPFVPVFQTVLIEERMTIYGEQVENTTWFESTGPIDALNMQEMAEAHQQWWMDAYAPLVSASVELVETVVTDMTTATSGQVSVAAPPGTTGAITAAGLPSADTLTVSFRTAQRGRSFRGRNYIVGLSEEQVSENEITTVLRDAWVAAYTQLIDIGVGVGYTWVVVSKYSGVDADGDPIPRLSGVTTPVTNVVVVDRFTDVQRRRAGGRGR